MFITRILSMPVDNIVTDEVWSLPDRDPTCKEFQNAHSATDSIYGDLTRGEGGYNCDGCEGNGDITRLEITDSGKSPFTSAALKVLTLYQRQNNKLWYDLISFDKAGGSMTGTPGYVSLSTVLRSETRPLGGDGHLQPFSAVTGINV